MKRIMFQTQAVFLIIFFAALCNSSAVEASAVDNLINKLVEKGILTHTEAENIRIEVENEEAANYVKHRNEETPWLEGLESKGDIRLRAESFSFDETNQKDRLRERVRVRWGLEKKFNEEWKAGFRVATGPTDEAVSTNQTLDDEFDFKNLNLNRAYATYTPTARFQTGTPGVQHVEIGAGKVANPYAKWGTSLIWDGDIEPEGIYERIDMKLADIGDGGTWELHGLFGQWVLEEQSTKKDVNMQSYGMGTTLAPDGGSQFTAKYAFYDWQDYDSILRAGVPNSEVDSIDASNLTGPGGNDTNVDAFKLHSIYLEGNWKNVDTLIAGQQPVMVFGQWLRNAEEGDSVARPGNDTAWTAGFTVGKAKEEGSGQFTYQYYEIEENSTIGNFSESDLGTGGTNKEGHQLQFQYQLTNAIQLAWTNWLVDDIVNTSTVTPQSNPEVWRSQVDLVFKF